MFVSLLYLAIASLMLHLALAGYSHNLKTATTWSWLAGLTGSECAPFLILLNVTMIFGLCYQAPDILVSPAGVLSVALQVFAIGVLGATTWVNIQSFAEFQEALKAQGIKMHVPSLITTVKRWCCILLPIPPPISYRFLYPQIRRISSITYANVSKSGSASEKKDLHMDVYKHVDCPAGAPVVIYIHGGYWIQGSRRVASLALLHDLAMQNVIVCTITYRLCPDVAFPDNLIDCKRAVAFVRENGVEQWQANVDKIIIAGESAGGHLASLVALTASDKSYQPGFEHVDLRVQGCLDLYGVHAFVNEHKVYSRLDPKNTFESFLSEKVMQKPRESHFHEHQLASPIYRLQQAYEANDSEKDEIPPFFLIHGTHDTLVPIEDTRYFSHYLQTHREKYDRKQQTHVRDVIVELQGAKHVYNYILSPRTFATSDAAIAVIKRL